MADAQELRFAAARALQAKIDEVLEATTKGRDELIGLKDRGEDEIEQMRLDDGQRTKAASHLRAIRVLSRWSRSRSQPGLRTCAR